MHWVLVLYIRMKGLISQAQHKILYSELIRDMFSEHKVLSTQILREGSTEFLHGQYNVSKILGPGNFKPRIQTAAAQELSHLNEIYWCSEIGSCLFQQLHFPPSCYIN